MNRIVVRLRTHLEDGDRRAPTLRAFYAELRRWYLEHDVLLHTIERDQHAAEEVRRLAPEAVLVWGAGPVGPGIEEGPWRIIRQELGWFPQGWTTYFDLAAGTGGALAGVNPDPDLGDFADWREQFLVSRWGAQATGSVEEPLTESPPPPPYLLVLGQSEGIDDPALKWSAVKTACGLVALALTSTDLPVVFRPKPCTHPSIATHPRVRISRGAPLYPLIDRATAVIGCTTTALLEAALIGRPVLALGRGAWPEGSLAVRTVSPESFAGELARVTQAWHPEAAWPWLNALRRIQVRMDTPDFSHPRTRQVLLGEA